MVGILEYNAKFLLVFRAHNPFKDMWALPGGHLDGDEEPIDAAIREIKEETSLDFSPTFYSVETEEFPEIDWYADVGVFTGSFSGTEHIIDTSEILRIKWFSPDDIRDMDLGFNHKKILLEYFEKVRK